MITLTSKQISVLQDIKKKFNIDITITKYDVVCCEVVGKVVTDEDETIYTVYIGGSADGDITDNYFRRCIEGIMEYIWSSYYEEPTDAEDEIDEYEAEAAEFLDTFTASRLSKLF